MKKFLVILLLAIPAVCFILTEKKQDKTPDRISVISSEMEVGENDQLPYSPMAVNSIVTEKKVFPVDSVKVPVILNSDIQEMVDLICKLNGIQNPNLIHPGQLLLCRFPDNRHFEFYEEVGNDQCLWSIVKNLLIVTSIYRPVYNSRSHSK